MGLLRGDPSLHHTRSESSASDEDRQRSSSASISQDEHGPETLAEDDSGLAHVPG
jgi:hypothetical protein